ncbi:hypothetical protein Hanom_Chr15g01370071 [Helianthus anomalus]
MCEQIMEFENAKREFIVERENFNVEKKSLNWWVSDVQEKLAKEQKLNAERQEECTVACSRTNRELKLARDEAVKLRGEKEEESRDVMCLSAIIKDKDAQAITTQKAHEKALTRIVVLESC